MYISLQRQCNFAQLGKRKSQEDCLYPSHTEMLTSFFVVCDGVGGRGYGEVASHLVCQTFDQNLTNKQCKTLSPNDILFLVELSYQTLHNNRAKSPNMATTLAFMAKTDKGMLVAHMGDSRIYQLRKGKGVIFQTKDHSLVNDLIDSGKITVEEAVNHPQRNVITKCIFVTDNRKNYQTPSISLIRDIKPHDIFMLCTDGVYEMLNNNTLSEILLSDCSLKDKTKELAFVCKNSNDNNTAYLVEIADVTGNEDTKINIQYTIEAHSKKKKCHFCDFIRKTIDFVKELASFK